ncbi:hypothetical protein [Schauerella aestuarii]|uniref:hypothetical protein n=1 Tax=Schauerella aestuarii TaxID=2511204 RepID=UPI00136AE1D4|nr:hypothetical protein [Achromobacter aestuarii]MYZ44187.1 hypothetical protein [Achromobacter aestuarii]
MTFNTHPLTSDPWAHEGAPEFSTIRTSHIGSVNRATTAIHAIARIAGNSVTSPDSTGSDPLPAYVVNALLGGIESLCDHISYITEEMQEIAEMVAKSNGAQE